MKLEHQAADKLFVDFAGKPLHYIDPSTGEIIACPVFVACLPFSDYSFAMAVPSQRIADFLHALECCLQHIGGTPKVLVPDNLKSAIIKADRYEPDVNRSLEDFANHYNITVVGSRVKVIYSMIYIYARGKQVAIHIRSYQPAGWGSVSPEYPHLAFG